MVTADATGARVNTLEPVTIQLTNMLDELYSQESKTTMWTPNPALVQGFKRSKTGRIPTIFTSGLADYGGSYAVGKSEVAYKDYTLQYDRAVQHRVDGVDLMKAGNVPTASAILADFARMAVIPELDATRIASVVQNVTTNLSDHVKTRYAPAKSTILETLRTGLNTIENETGIDSGMNILFNTKYKPMLSDAAGITLTRPVSGASSFNNKLADIDDNKITYVPAKRMWSKLAMVDGTLSESNHVGFKPAPGEGAEVVALITAPDTAQAIVAHEVTRIFGPEVVQDFDGSKINYHVYHDCLVPFHKLPGVYAILSDQIAPGARGPEAVQAAKAAEPTSKKKN